MKIVVQLGSAVCPPERIFRNEIWKDKNLFFPKVIRSTIELSCRSSLESIRATSKPRVVVEATFFVDSGTVATDSWLTHRTTEGVAGAAPKKIFWNAQNLGKKLLLPASFSIAGVGHTRRAEKGVRGTSLHQVSAIACLRAEVSGRTLLGFCFTRQGRLGRGWIAESARQRTILLHPLLFAQLVFSTPFRADPVAVLSWFPLVKEMGVVQAFLSLCRDTRSEERQSNEDDHCHHRRTKTEGGFHTRNVLGTG